MYLFCINEYFIIVLEYNVTHKIGFQRISFWFTKYYNINTQGKPGKVKR